MSSLSGEIRTRGKKEHKIPQKSGLLLDDFILFEEPRSRLGFSEAGFEKGHDFNVCARKWKKKQGSKLEVESQQSLN